jgi:putative hydrolase of HD superfamily
MVTKAAGPDELLALRQDADPALASYFRIMRLKRLYRQGWLKRGLPEGLCESVAEHSFGTALLALLLAGPSGSGGELGRLDTARAALLALVHELGESFAGDITPVDGVSREEKSRLEREAIYRALEGHPDLEWFLSLWEEFEAGLSPEARFVRQLDRLEMGLQAALQDAEGFPGMEEFYDSARRSVVEPRLRALLEEAIAAAGKASGA